MGLGAVGFSWVELWDLSNKNGDVFFLLTIQSSVTAELVGFGVLSVLDRGTRFHLSLKVVCLDMRHAPNSSVRLLNRLSTSHLMRSRDVFSISGIPR